MPGRSSDGAVGQGGRGSRWSVGGSRPESSPGAQSSSGTAHRQGSRGPRPASAAASDTARRRPPCVGPTASRWRGRQLVRPTAGRSAPPPRSRSAGPTAPAPGRSCRSGGGDPRLPAQAAPCLCEAGPQITCGRTVLGLGRAGQPSPALPTKPKCSQAAKPMTPPCLRNANPSPRSRWAHAIRKRAHPVRPLRAVSISGQEGTGCSVGETATAKRP